MAINTKLHKRASIKDKDGSEYGHRSEVEGIVCDDPDKLRGDRCQLLIYEEAGSVLSITVKVENQDITDELYEAGNNYVDTLVFTISVN